MGREDMCKEGGGRGTSRHLANSLPPSIPCAFIPSLKQSHSLSLSLSLLVCISRRGAQRASRMHGPPPRPAASAARPPAWARGSR